MRTSALLATTLITISGSSASAFGAPIEPVIRWSSGEVETLRDLSPSQVLTRLRVLAERGEGSHIVVHFAEVLTDDIRRNLESRGLVLLSPLGGNSYFASIDEDLDAGWIVGQGLRSVSEIPVGRKLHKDLAAGIVRPWMVSQGLGAADPEIRRMLDSGFASAEEFAARGVDPTLAVIVQFHRNMNPRAESRRLAATVGGEVLSEIYTVNAVTMHLPLSQVGSLAADDSVQWIEPPLPAMVDLNAENRAAMGVDVVNASPYDLDGSGVTVMVFDGGQVKAHADFGSRLTVGTSDHAGESNHATHVAGTIGGDGTIEHNNRGMAPGVEIISYGFEVEGGLSAGFLYTEPGDIEADYTESLALYGFDIANNSIGTNIEPNGFPCEWTGNYGITSAMIDSIVRGGLGEPVRIVWANGNERSRTRCLGDDFGNHGEFFSTAPPACAKNHITVGSVDSDTDLISYFSSWGPTDDGRLKPDISAPGCESASGVGVLSTTGVDSYGTACGTSMAAPTVTGLCALILEQYAISYPGRALPMNATLKALLANTAVDRGNPGADYAYGYGSVRAQPAVDAVLAGNILEGAVAQDGVYRFTVEVLAGDPSLKVTVAWDDLPGTPNVASTLVNDLDVRVIDGSGGEHLPWTLDPTDPGAPAVRTAQDHLNNIEQVQIDNPLPGMYTVEVSGFVIADGGAQRFGASTTGLLTDCSSTGFITLGRASVSCAGDGTSIRVTDCDLNSSDAVLDQIFVELVSDSQPGGTLITLTETGPATGRFSGSFTHNSTGGSDLLVRDGDTITAIYTDMDDGRGNADVPVMASMVVDCTPPVAAVHGIDIWYDHATVEVTADEQSSCRILVGEQGGPLDMVTDSFTLFGLNHTVLIEELVELTDYVYAIELTDAGGNITLDDHNGAGYPFRTIEGPVSVFEYLVDDTDPGWEMTGDWEFGPATGLNGNPAAAYTGTNIIGYDLDGTPPWHMPREYLTTGSMDFTGVHEVRLDFQRWLGMVPDIFGEASIEYRLGDGEWQLVWAFSGGRLSNDEWEYVSYEVFGVDNQPAVQFRWVMGETDIHIDECGWNLDDIRFTGVVPPAACPADFTGDGTLDIFDVFAFLDAFNSAAPAADMTGDGLFDVFDVFAFLDLFNTGCP